MWYSIPGAIPNKVFYILVLSPDNNVDDDPD
jgi:hypothetical protein